MAAMPDEASARPRPYIEDAVPFLKWAGGKSQLLDQYAPYLPPREQVGRYYEPFIGSAAVYFHLQPTRSCLADVNGKLIEIYRVVQQEVESLIQALKGHRNERAYY
jgi:DNA adenine methylase